MEKEVRKPAAAGKDAKCRAWKSLNERQLQVVLRNCNGAVGSRGGTDRVRIKVWDPVTGQLVYDTQPGAGDTSDPTTDLVLAPFTLSPAGSGCLRSCARGFVTLPFEVVLIPVELDDEAARAPRRGELRQAGHLLGGPHALLRRELHVAFELREAKRTKPGRPLAPAA
jgi:hypothetical protein